MNRTLEQVNPNHLAAMSYANGNTWWSYQSPTPGGHSFLHKDFWAPVKDMLKPGDLIVASALTSDHARFSHILTVVKSTPDVIVQKHG